MTVERTSALPDADWPISRRSVLRAGAVAGGAVAGRALAAPATARGATIRYVVADRRFAESLAFARVLEDRGALRLDVADGLTRLWSARLVPHWRDQAGAVAGLTTPGVWDCLSQQARDHFRKARLLGRHAVSENVGATLPEWPLTAADAACRGLPELGVRCAAFPPRGPRAQGQMLLSWMIG